MKDFEYFAPKTVEEALSLLSQYKGEAKIIAGGQSMLVIMRQGLLAPEYVVDIKGISALDYMTYDERQGLKIGALTTHRTIEKSPVIQKHFGVLSEMETKSSHDPDPKLGDDRRKSLSWGSCRGPGSRS